VRHLVGRPVGVAVRQRPEAVLGVGARARDDRDLVGVAPGEPFEHVADRRAFPPVHGAAAAQGGDVEGRGAGAHTVHACLLPVAV
jgi:hypothetical protein